jgi:Ser/Thr protein kinase RdoA (MazF antagonist)
MMNTDVMRKLVAEAELGKRDMPTATAAAAYWGFEQGTLTDVRYSANAIYFFKQRDVPCFMRLTWSGDRSREQLEAELDFLDFLRQQKYPVVRFIHSLKGNRIEEIANTYGQFNAVTFTAAKGTYLPIDALGDDQIRTWGQLLGKLHKLSANYQPPRQNYRPNWTDIIETYTAWIPGNAVNTRRYLGEARVWLGNLPASESGYGLIHWDFEPDNLTWQDGGIEVFDFDDAAYFWYEADIAFALDDVLDKPAQQASYIVKHFLDSYQSVRQLGKDWLSRLPQFVRLMRVLKSARVYHAFENTHPELDPSWLKKLRKRLMGEVMKLEDYFTQSFQAPLTPREVEIWGI